MRCGRVRDDVRRSSHESGLFARQVICPSGVLSTCVSIPCCKNISVFNSTQIISRTFASHPTIGAYRDRHGRGAGCGGRGSVLRADGIAGRVTEPVSDQQHADERCCSVRRSRVVLTPRRWRQVRGCCVGPTGLRTQHKFANDGGKRARSPRRARRKPLKPLRAGMPGDSGVLVVTRVRSTNTSAHEAAGAAGTRHFPRPLWAGDKCKPRAQSRREDEDVRETTSTSLRGATRRSNPLFLHAARWIASRSLSSGAHSRDPLARNDGLAV